MNKTFADVSSAPTARLEPGALVPEGPKRWFLSSVRCPDGGASNVGEDQTTDMSLFCLSTHRKGGSVTADTTSEMNRSIPPRGVGEHEIAVAGPLREDEKFGSPEDATLLGANRVAIGGMRRVDHRHQVQRQTLGGRSFDPRFHSPLPGQLSISRFAQRDRG